jgi:hypothetical protein
MKIRKQILRDACWYFTEKVDNKPHFFEHIVETLNNSVEIEGIIEVDEKLIKDICYYCETQAIYDKLGRYGDFYYKFKRYFWK